MKKLSEMINIGEKAEKQLIQVGIETPKQLVEVGSREAFLRIRAIDDGACLSKLCALEGAIQNIRWHYLSDEDKKSLKEFFKGLK